MLIMVLVMSEKRVMMIKQQNKNPQSCICWLSMVMMMMMVVVMFDHMNIHPDSDDDDDNEGSPRHWIAWIVHKTTECSNKLPGFIGLNTLVTLSSTIRHFFYSFFHL